MSVALWIVAVVAMLGAEHPTSEVAPPPRATGPYTIAGTVFDEDRQIAAEHALVILHCTCLHRAREAATDAGGRYRFSNLPAGDYLVQVLVGRADVSRQVRLGPSDEPPAKRRRRRSR